MPTVKVTIHLRAPDGAMHTLHAKCGQSLMLAAVQEGVDAIAADCGGCLTCATCHVYVDASWGPRLPPAGADETAMLDLTAAERRPTSRLSCQIELTPALDGLVVELPERQY
jgi:ferredoxin, 2Fe-2S